MGSDEKIDAKFKELMDSVKITYIEDLEKLLKATGIKSFIANYFLENMVGCMNFRNELISSLTHSISCSTYIHQKKRGILEAIMMIGGIEQFLRVDPGTGKKPNPEEVLEHIVASIPEVLSKTAQDYASIVNRQTLILMHSFFEFHVKDLLGFLFHVKPEVMLAKEGSGKTMAYKEIIQQKDFSSLLDKMIENEIRSYDSKNYDDKRKYFEKNLGVSLDLEPEKYNFMIKEINDLRNEILHNASSVKISEKYLYKAHEYLVKLGLELMVRFKKKFGIDGWVYPYPSNPKGKT